jgi:hypothetical protein
MKFDRNFNAPDGKRGRHERHAEHRLVATGRYEGISLGEQRFASLGSSYARINFTPIPGRAPNAGNQGETAK